MSSDVGTTQMKNEQVRRKTTRHSQRVVVVCTAQLTHALTNIEGLTIFISYKRIPSVFDISDQNKPIHKSRPIIAGVDIVRISISRQTTVS